MREITTATKIGSRKQLTGLLLSALIQKGAGTELAKPLKKSKRGLGPQFYNLNCGGLQVCLFFKHCAHWFCVLLAVSLKLRLWSG